MREPRINLEQLAALRPNWDGEGGKTMTAEALDTARNLCFVPCNGGGIQIEMHAGGIDFELQIDPNGVVSGFFYEQSK